MMADDSDKDEDSHSQWEDRFPSSSSDSSSDEDGSSWESFHSSSSSDEHDTDDDDNSDSDYETDDSVDVDRNNDGRLESSSIRNMTGIRFRRQPRNNADSAPSPSHRDYDRTITTSKTRKRGRFRSSKANKVGPTSVFTLYKKAIMLMCSKKSTMLLLVSIFIWLYAQFLLTQTDINPDAQSVQDDGPFDETEEKKRLEKSAFEALGQAAAPFVKHKKKKEKDSRDKHKAGDKLPKDCKAYSWQTFSFPNCNDVHEVDLKQALHITRRGKIIPADLGEGDKSEKKWSMKDKIAARKMGYMGSGLWRQVWRVDPRMGGESAVLKVMKAEHEIDARNFDRHRRDSLVMERLTSSPNVVSAYGFCGNTVLTEYAGITLEDYLYDDVEIYDKYDRNTSRGKIQLALEVMRGVKALHDIKDGPIVHADIQAKQFLFNPLEGVKVNDFNRCRILPKNNITGKVCKLRIPSAPGGHRSPEEYELMKIDEKADVYSTANVLYGILTGKRPYENKLRREIRRNVMNAKKPEIPKDFLKAGTNEAALGEIIDNAYSFDPKDRWSASKIVELLESMLEKERH